MLVKSIQKICSTIALIIFFWISNKNVFATSKTSLNSQYLNLDSPRIQNNTLQVAQNCEEGRKPQQYVQVVTKQDEALEIRSSPDGRVIGAIPNGWNLVPLRKDPTGRWIQITDHQSVLYGESFLDEGPANFRSAPLFRRGWVESTFLKDVGQHCDKPTSLQSLHPQMGLEIRGYEDWLQLGDRIAETSYNQIPQ